MCTFSCLGEPRKIKGTLSFSKIFSFDSYSSMKLLSSKVAKMLLLNMVQFYPGRACHHHLCLNYWLRRLRYFHRKNLCESINRKLYKTKAIVSITEMVIILHYFSRLIILINYIICSFQKVGLGEKESKILEVPSW